MTVAGAAALPREIEDALARHHLRARRVELVSPLRERKGVRLAYRVETEDGRTIKLRRFPSEAEADAHLALRARLGDGFAPATGRAGAVLFEEWIEGVPLAELDDEAWTASAGALLGRLHALPVGSGGDETTDTQRWRAAAESDLEILRRAGALSPAEGSGLRLGLERSDPGIARLALVHKDFCAENMLVDGLGRLRVIDNEQLEIGPAGFDLGRTYHRWPMSPVAWTRFLRGYLSSAPGDPGATGFWRLAAALVGARVFLERMPERLEASIELLRRFAAGRDLDHVEHADR